MTAFLGIDPGKSGALAIVGGAGGGIAYAEVHKMPETDRGVMNLLRELKGRHQIRYALLEKLHALPAAVAEQLGIKRGSIATAKLMSNYGALKMALIASEIHFEEKVPRSWQRIIGLKAGGGKKASHAMAQELFPAVKVTHAVADALLIAWVARCLWLNSHPERRSCFSTKKEEIETLMGMRYL
jgi:Holliday junction resolvasome RuvABC endonuclease subunit